MHRTLRHVIPLLVAASPALAQSGIFRSFPGPGNVYGMTPDGLTVVGFQPSGAFRWSDADGATILGPGRATAISADGSVIAGIQGTNAVQWTSSGVTTLGPGNSAYMSGDGSVVTGMRASGSSEGYRWSAQNGYQSLPDLPGVGAQSHQSWGISGDGQTVLGSVSYSGGIPAVRYTASGASSLGTIPGGGNPDALASASSYDGGIIYGMGRGPHGYDTFRWTQDTGTVLLGVAAAGFGAPLPAACTPDGGIIAGSAGFRAFVWTIGSGPEDVQTVLEQHYGIDLGGLQLISVTSISADGRTVAGLASNGSYNQGWVAHLGWSIPSPGALPLIGIGAAVAVRRRRSRGL